MSCSDAHVLGCENWQRCPKALPAEARRPRALETKSVTRKTLEVYATSVREPCGWSGLLADSNVEALEVDRLLTKFMNLLFLREPLGLVKARNCWQASSSSFQLSRSWRGIGWLGASEPLEDGKRHPPRFSRRPLLAAVWSARALEICRIGGTLAACSKLISEQRKCCHRRRVESEAGRYCCSLRLVPREAKLERRTTRSVSTQNDVYGWHRFSSGFSDDSHRTNLCSTSTTKSTCCCSGEPPLTCRWIWCHVKDGTLELRWTGPKTCECWSPHKNADDGHQPSLCAATRKADVSTKVGQRSRHWSRHTASTSTTSCPRFCFMAMLHRHRLDCFVFCDPSLQRKHRFATVFSSTEVYSARDSILFEM